MISIIVPVYNEEKTVGELLAKVISLPIDKEIIVVNDCSTDKTAEILESIKDDHLRIINQPRNYGKGAAIRSGLKYASGEITVIQDADLELDPTDIIKLIKPIQKGITDVVFGVRINYNKITLKHFFLCISINFALAIFQLELLLLYGYFIGDLMSCYKVMRTDLLKSLELSSNGFEVEAEITAKLLKKRLKPYEITIQYMPRYYNQGKKIKWYDSLKILVEIAKNRFK